MLTRGGGEGGGWKVGDPLQDDDGNCCLLSACPSYIKLFSKNFRNRKSPRNFRFDYPRSIIQEFLMSTWLDYRIFLPRGSESHR